MPKSSRMNTRFTVNGNSAEVADRILNGRQILACFDLHPADEHVLIHLTEPGSVSIGLDEPVDLKHSATSEFYAWQSDRVFRFTIDGVGAEWGAPKITEAEIRRVGVIDEDSIIVLEQTDEPDRELEEDDTVDLNERGTEHLRSKDRLLTVCFNGEDVEIPRGVYTNEQLLEQFSVEPGYVLDLVDENGEFRLLGPNEKIKMRDGLKFVSHVPRGAAA